jgi:hypothetical protein
LTLINVNAAIVAGEAGAAQTLETVIHVAATASIGAGFREAEINSLLADGARKARRAFALILINAIDACTAIFARISMTIVDVFFAICALEALSALTLILIAAD